MKKNYIDKMYLLYRYSRMIQISENESYNFTSTANTLNRIEINPPHNSIFHVPFNSPLNTSKTTTPIGPIVVLVSRR